MLRDQIKHLTTTLQRVREQQEQKPTTERDTAGPLEPQTDAELQRAQPHQMDTPLPPASRVCYLPASDSDGYSDNASPIGQIGRNIYQLSTTDGVNGTFIMLNGSDAIATVMINVSQFVKPVRKIVDDAGVYPRSIKMVDEGSTMFESGI